MAKDKERSVNPAQQQRKLEKAKALKKSRAELQSRRNEKLARRNPDRIQRQIDDLKALESSGDIKPREKAILEELERDLKAVRKAREALGGNASGSGNKTPFSDRKGGRAGEDKENRASVLGKRGYDGERKQKPRYESSGSETDESVRRIPMPEDTPPPAPRQNRRYHNYNNENNPHSNEDANGQPPQHTPKFPPPVETRTTYESAPQIRDLKKEAVSRFVPNVVRRKQDAIKGSGGQLIEPEEMDRLEAQGYGYQQRTNHERNSSDALDRDNDTKRQTDPNITANEEEDVEDLQRLEEEEARFQREMAMDEVAEDEFVPLEKVEKQTSNPPLQNRPKHVEIEEVEDEEA